LLNAYPVLIWSFFFGLIIASALIILKKITDWNIWKVIFLISGIAVSFFITAITPAQTPTALWFVFLSGALAICAMILPGISGSFILLLLGKYQFVLEAVNEMKINVLITVIAGAAVGLLAFSNLLSWLLKRFHGLTVAVLSGFMIGSLNKVWPWKIAEKQITKGGDTIPVAEKNVLPAVYQEITSNEAFTKYAILLAIAGMLVIFLFDKFSTSKKSNS